MEAIHLISGLPFFLLPLFHLNNLWLHTQQKSTRLQWVLPCFAMMLSIMSAGFWWTGAIFICVTFWSCLTSTEFTAACMALLPTLYKGGKSLLILLLQVRMKNFKNLSPLSQVRYQEGLHIFLMGEKWEKYFLHKNIQKHNTTLYYAQNISMQNSSFLSKICVLSVWFCECFYWQENGPLIVVHLLFYFNKGVSKSQRHPFPIRTWKMKIHYILNCHNNSVCLVRFRNKDPRSLSVSIFQLELTSGSQIPVRHSNHYITLPTWLFAFAKWKNSYITAFVVTDYILYIIIII